MTPFQLASCTNPFDDNGQVPPHPVLAHYGNADFHRLRLRRRDSSWNIRRMAENLDKRILRSDSGGMPGDKHWIKVVFGTKRGLFIHFDEGHLWLYGPSLRSVHLLARLLEQYLEADEEEPQEFGTYHLLRVSRGDLSTFAVTMKAEFGLPEEKLSLNYGSEFLDWHRGFIAALMERPHGLTILDGTPGCGKTSYLRHLMVELRETHRFYFVPPSTVGIVSNPDFIDFWNGEKREAEGKKLVMVLEDAESAVAPRAIDNRSEVSAILNVTDGLLADFLQLHIVATINCGTADIDQALLRPGRLMAQRTFGRLSHADGHRLASSLGKELPLRKDYSLAEIFGAQPIRDGASRIPRIGFAA
jgi:ATPase family associated with various cellular activities (AAA)